MVVVILKVGAWIVTPSSPGWNTVVYPASENLLTLPSFLFNPGTMIASLALLGSSGIGNCTLVVAFNVESSGRYMVVLVPPIFGKFSSSRKKCDVAPELIMGWMAD